ncbi:MAG: DUF2834 domain-containing protein [Pseudomonadota bacterium]|nr:DUF2834 domain-containing protein [Pseudomonadota bacterium]
MKWLWAVFCVLGTLVPMSQLALWIAEYGPDLPRMVQQVGGDRLSRFAWLDVVLSALALIAYVLWDQARGGFRHAVWVILATCTIGVSLGLPLYFLLKPNTKSSAQ